MPEYTFPRTGKPPLACEGETVATATSQLERGNLRTRWHELTLVRAAGGRIVLAVQYRTKYDQNETPHAYAEALAELQAVPPALDNYDPIEHVAGYPEGEQFRERQQRLLADIQRGYYDACGRLLAQAGIVERV